MGAVERNRLLIVLFGGKQQHRNPQIEQLVVQSFVLVRRKLLAPTSFQRPMRRGRRVGPIVAVRLTGPTGGERSPPAGTGARRGPGEMTLLRGGSRLLQRFPYRELTMTKLASDQKNILGRPLMPCSMRPKTGFFRTGCCDTGPADHGLHVVCIQATEAFLAFSRARGNDLSTPRPEFDFPGLKPGDRWCLCAARWKEALDAGVAPPVVLASTHEAALQIVARQDLVAHAIDGGSLN